jgi:mRNA interferase MazF
MAIPERGEVWVVDLGYAAKTRPGVVISIAFLDQDRALTTLVPHTTSTRASRFEVEIPKSFLKGGAFDAQSIVTVPSVKVFKRLGKLTAEELARIEDAVRHWLGL